MKMLILVYNYTIYLVEKAIKIGLFLKFDKQNKSFLLRNEIFLHKRKNIQFSVWLHCASAGEFELAIPIINKLKTRNWTIVVTFFSLSGYEMFSKSELIDHCYLLPLDTPYNGKAVYNTIQPNLAIFVDKELWYNYLSILKQNNTPTFLINSNFTSNSIYFKSILKNFYKHILSCFSHIFCVDKETVETLKVNGIQKAFFSGDLRFERTQSTSSSNVGIEKQKDITTLIIGSAWLNELKMLKQFIEKNLNENLKIILVPHEPQNKSIQNYIKYHFSFFTEINDFEWINKSNKKYIVVKQKGNLKSLYALADIVWIGIGKQNKIHNILEASAYRIPAFWLENYKKSNITQTLIKKECGFVINNPDDIKRLISELTMPNRKRAISERIKEIYENQSNSSEIIMEKIKSEVPELN